MKCQAHPAMGDFHDERDIPRSTAQLSERGHQGDSKRKAVNLGSERVRVSLMVSKDPALQGYLRECIDERVRNCVIFAACASFASFAAGAAIGAILFFIL